MKFPITVFGMTIFFAGITFKMAFIIFFDSGKRGMRGSAFIEFGLRFVLFLLISWRCLIKASL